MRHKIYLNIQSFVSDLVLNILLYGKYTVIETSIDLNFHRRFVSIDEYMAWTTKQVLIDLKKYTKLLTDDTTIQDLYLIMDQTRNNEDVIFDIEQLIRSVVPFSLYMDSKDNIYESYFELIECYLEDLLLFKSYSELEDIEIEPAKVKIPLPFKFEPKFIPDINELESVESKIDLESESVDLKPESKQQESKPEPEQQESEPESKQQESEPESEQQVLKPEPESDSESEQQEFKPNFDPEPDQESDSESEQQVLKPNFEPEPDPESDSESEQQEFKPNFEPEPDPKSDSGSKKEEFKSNFEPETVKTKLNELKDILMKESEERKSDDDSESEDDKPVDPKTKQIILQTENGESVEINHQKTRKSKKETQESYDKRIEEALRSFLVDLTTKNILISRPNIRKVFGALDYGLVNRVLMSIVKEMIVEKEQGIWKISHIDKRIIKEFLLSKGVKVPDRINTDEKTRKVIDMNIQQLVI